MPSCRYNNDLAAIMQNSFELWWDHTLVFQSRQLDAFILLRNCCWFIESHWAFVFIEVKVSAAVPPMDTMYVSSEWWYALFLPRPLSQCSSTCPCHLNRFRNRQRLPATCLHLSTSCLFKPMPMARPVVSYGDRIACFKTKLRWNWWEEGPECQ